MCLAFREAQPKNPQHRWALKAARTYGWYGVLSSLPPWPLQCRKWTSGSGQFVGPAEIDRNQLRNAALDHCYTIQPVHPGHGEPVVGDDHEARAGVVRDLLNQQAETVDIGVVERRVDLVQHADWRRVGEEH